LALGGGNGADRPNTVSEGDTANGSPVVVDHR
jgi:hypothetical protein